MDLGTPSGANGLLRSEFKDKLALHPIGEQEARTKPVRAGRKKLPVNLGQEDMF
ncbi:hypothetical protein [Nitrosospira sp. Nsp11]|uniref:hypothetical protein n=1 Tax=Nitrosospira sp. Nsp11 TaxID=1855338 RepID=UPI0015B5F620|nr:hypothetical protein [Nitrosospira sp. Nsp11]